MATADELIQKQNRAEADRSVLDQHCREIGERILPGSASLFSGGYEPEGSKRNEKALDATGAIALERYSAILASLLTPENQKWHHLTSDDPNLNKIPRVRNWFDEARDILFRERSAPRSGFQGQMNSTYLSNGAFGTGSVYIDFVNPTPTDPTGGLRYKSLHLSETYFFTNFQGVIDSFHRKFKLTHRQCKQMVEAGKLDRLPKGVEEKLKSGKSDDEKFTYILCVEPNKEFDGSRSDHRGKPFSLQYVCQDTREIIATSGYHEFPLAIGRASVVTNEVYGRSPAMMVLPNIKVLNEQKKTQIKIGHRLADPILLAHDDGILDTYSARPGSITAGGVSKDGRKLVQRLDDNVGQVAEVANLMDQEKLVIKDAFLETLFQILTENPRMTATEVLERMREKSMLMAPTMGRMQNEQMGTMIHRELGLMIRHGRMPEMPPELIEAQGEYTVRYDSPLSRIMRAEEGAGLSRWVEQSLIAAQAMQDPSALDWVNWDVVQPELADINGVPSRWVATPDQVEAKRESRNQQQTVQTAIEAGPSVAALVKAGADGQ